MKSYTFYTGERKEVIERLSIYQGLNELQEACLRKEIYLDNTRPASTLRRIAKRKAFIQQTKWILENVLLTATLVAVIAITLIITMILQY